MSLDPNGQPYNTRFNFNRNLEKAAFGLKGILEGITSDQELNSQELLFLDIWLRSHEALKNDGDAIDLLDLISDILSDGIITASELDDIHATIKDVIEYKEQSDASVEARTNELLGFLAGIIADSKITESEVLELSKWLAKNSDILNTWPASVVSVRVQDILSDGIISTEEKEDLLELLKQITGIRFDESGIAHGMTTEFFEDDIDQLQIEGACYCFSGTFVTGTRKVVEDSVKSKGATTKKDVSKEVDYLVIGTIASRDWRFSSHGRKIEKALNLKDSKHGIKIITERSWLNNM